MSCANTSLPWYTKDSPRWEAHTLHQTVFTVQVDDTLRNQFPLLTHELNKAPAYNLRTVVGAGPPPVHPRSMNRCAILKSSPLAIMSVALVGRMRIDEIALAVLHSDDVGSELGIVVLVEADVAADAGQGRGGQRFAHRVAVALQR